MHFIHGLCDGNINDAHVMC